ncbi:MAG: glycosyltransferase family 4 protein [Desulfobulbus sp.]|nr:glycosyltransferase family 4 protein [Desulfobulbus sp.]
MKILALCKRRPQGRDLFTYPYGRFYHLPCLLAERGHEVHLLLLGYRNEPPAYRREGNLHCHSVSVLPLGPWPYLQKAAQLAAALKPDWVIGFSDIWYGILAERIARKAGAQSLIDAYDNYESYIPWLKPLHHLWRHSLARANVVTAAGPQLANFMSRFANGRPVKVIEMSADPVFFPRSKSACRKQLGLPLDKTLLGYSGSLHPGRGIQLLFSVFEKVKEVMPDVELIVSGRLSKNIKLPSHVRWLGYLPAEEVPAVINSLDLMFAFNKPGAFGNYSYPVKIYEALACGVPVIASGLPGTAWVLRNHPELLAKPEDIDDFVEKIISLHNAQLLFKSVSGWQDSATQLEKLLTSSDNQLCINKFYANTANKYDNTSLL